MHPSEVANHYRDRILRMVRQKPADQDVDRWLMHRIADEEHAIALPATFTPYAPVKSCSTRCHFCSKNFRELHNQQHTSMLKPGKDYLSLLTLALQQLQDTPLS